MEEKGALTEAVYYILLALGAPLHGYGIMQRVKGFSHGRVALGAGTLYGAISSLLAKGWIEPCASGDARRKEYRLTSLGRDALAAEVERLGELYHNGIAVLGGKEDEDA